MRKKLIAANWKMHLGPKEARTYVAEFLNLVNADAHKEWIFFVPSVDLPALQEMLAGLGSGAGSSIYETKTQNEGQSARLGSGAPAGGRGSAPGLSVAPAASVLLSSSKGIKYGAQNCHYESKGAFTGEISVSMLKELGCQYTLVGHSERRQLFGETNATCAKKIKALIEGGITPMLCVGETQAERDAGQTQHVLKRQLNESLAAWLPTQPMTIAYEPVWAIGTGKVATPAMAEEAHVAIRKILGELTGTSQRASEIQILYGGSVKPENSRELAAFPNIDGFLVGGASLAAKSFAQIGQLPL